MKLESGVLRYYAEEYNEERRLERTLKGRLELERMRKLIGRHLVGDGVIADIGGGAGVHARWLMGRGTPVFLCDPVPSHVAKARRHGVSAKVGDARELPFSDDEFDGALVAGPLYHLKEAPDRRRALAEVARVCRPGSPVLVTALNRFAPLIGSTVAATLHSGRFPGAQASIAERGMWDGEGWMGTAYYHRHLEFAGELMDAGFELEEMVGVGGPGTWLGVAADAYEDMVTDESAALACAMEAARIADAHPELLVLSSMFAALARTPR